MNDIPNNLFKDLVGKMSRDLAIKTDRIGVSIISDYLKEMPSPKEVYNKASIVFSESGFYKYLMWDGNRIAIFTDPKISEEMKDNFSRFLTIKASYRLLYSDNKEVKEISEDEYFEWLQSEKIT